MCRMVVWIKRSPRSFIPYVNYVGSHVYYMFINIEQNSKLQLYSHE